MRKYHADLLKAEIDYGVDKGSHHCYHAGGNPPGHLMWATKPFSTSCLPWRPWRTAARDRFWEKIPEKNRVTRAEYEKSCRKAEWAYKELVAFLTYMEKEGMEPQDIYDIIGSYAGAMSFAQFMPSNILILAEDSNDDGSINLFHHEDAIASIANYLKYYGWGNRHDREDAGRKWCIITTTVLIMWIPY
ncbi:MAG: lytic murein transglycosylase [Desulfobacterales bacterium]